MFQPIEATKADEVIRTFNATHTRCTSFFLKKIIFNLFNSFLVDSIFAESDGVEINWLRFILFLPCAQWPCASS